MALHSQDNLLGFGCPSGPNDEWRSVAFTPCKAAIEFQGWHGLPPLSFEGTRPTAMGTHLLGIVHDDLDLGEVEVRSMFKLRFRI